MAASFCQSEDGICRAIARPAGLARRFRLQQRLYPDWHDLRQTRDALDEVIEQWLAGMAQDFLTSTMCYTNIKGVQRAHPAWQAMTHFFNHQTDHRGQVTTLLSQAGVDMGVTDLIALA